MNQYSNKHQKIQMVIKKYSNIQIEQIQYGGSTNSH